MQTTPIDAGKLLDLKKIPVCFANMLKNMVLIALLESAMMPTNADPANGTT